jgi:transcription elongation GreA/GreB family factor
MTGSKKIIVGIDEIYDHHPQHISIESPMARALLSKQVDDEVEVITPLGKKCGISTQFAMKNLKMLKFLLF